MLTTAPVETDGTELRQGVLRSLRSGWSLRVPPSCVPDAGIDVLWRRNDELRQYGMTLTEFAFDVKAECHTAHVSGYGF